MNTLLIGWNFLVYSLSFLVLDCEHAMICLMLVQEHLYEKDNALYSRAFSCDFML